MNMKLPFSRRPLPTRVVLSYIFDYIIIFVLAGGFITLDAVEPFHQPFSLRNYTLQYPYAVHERIPVPLAFGLSCVLPAIVIAFYSLVVDGLFSHHVPGSGSGGRLKKGMGRYSLKHRLWELNCGVLGLCLSIGAAFVITGALKNAIGKPRPDLIDRCQPRPGSVDPPIYGLSNHSICTQTDNAILKDGFRSFPSGHSSTAFAGLYYLSLYLAAKLHVLDSRGEVWKTFIVLIPCLGAALIAGSRIMDARHHPFDVISGSLLGILVAWASYRQYFPPLHESWRKGRAYPVRSWGTEPAPPVDRMDSASEPLRTPSLRQRGGTGFSSATAVTQASEPGENVFRKQVAASQRQREAQSGGYRAGPSSAYSVPTDPASSYTSDLPAANPFANASYEGRNRRDDYYSSEDDSDDIELRPQYTLTDPEGGISSYDPVSGKFGRDTEYHSQPQAPMPLRNITSPQPPQPAVSPVEGTGPKLPAQAPL